MGSIDVTSALPLSAILDHECTPALAKPSAVAMSLQQYSVSAASAELERLYCSRHERTALFFSGCLADQALFPFIACSTIISSLRTILIELYLCDKISFFQKMTWALFLRGISTRFYSSKTTSRRLQNAELRNWYGVYFFNLYFSELCHQCKI